MSVKHLPLNNYQITEFKCHNLSLELGGKSLFKDLFFNFTGPGIVMVEGENGTGKSSLLKVFAGFIIPESGHVSFSGRSSSQIAKGDFSYLTTTSLGLLNDLTGREHIELISKALKIDSEKMNLKLTEYQELELFNEVLIKPVSQYSQGMRQLLRFFIHVFFEPKILFLDEPFLYLSPKLKDFLQLKVELISNHSLVFITDQKFSWDPNSKTAKIILGAK